MANQAPETFITTPANPRPMLLAAGLLGVAVLWLLAATVFTLYLTSETVVARLGEMLLLGGIGLWTLYRGMARHEFRLNSESGRYCARWNRLAECRSGSLTEIASFAAKPSADGKTVEVWLAWKSLDMNPLLIAVCPGAEAAQQLASRLTEVAASHPRTSEAAARNGSGAKRHFSWRGGVFFVVVALLALGTAVHFGLVEAAFADHGIRTTGRITSRFTTPGRNRLVYHVDYGFRAGGHNYNGEAITGRQFYRRAQRGFTVGLDYLPEDPRVSRLDADSNDWRFLYVGAAFCLWLGSMNIRGGLQASRAACRGS